MTSFVSIPAIMFIVMVGFIIFLLAFNFYLFYKWDKSIQELDRLQKNYNNEVERAIKHSQIKGWYTTQI
jgi:Tfp pilus assembly protein PilO